MQNCSLHLVALTATYRRSLNSPLPSIINAWLNGQLAVSTSWSLGKEKSSRIDARIFPDPMGYGDPYVGFRFAQRKRKRF